MRIENKKGEAVGNQTMWVWIMFLIVIAAGGIAMGVLIFYGYEYDLRTTEAQILSGVIGNCLSSQEINFATDDFYSQCRLNKKILFDELNVTKINILICKENCNNGEVVFQLGSDFQSCDFLGKNEKYKRCFKRFSRDSKGNPIEIIVASNHALRRFA